MLVQKYRDSLAQEITKTTNHQYLQGFFELYQLFKNNFFMPNFPNTLIVHDTQATYFILAQFCVITHPNLFLSNLACISCTNLFLWSN